MDRRRVSIVYSQCTQDSGCSRYKLLITINEACQQCLQIIKFIFDDCQMKHLLGLLYYKNKTGSNTNSILPIENLDFSGFPELI